MGVNTSLNKENCPAVPGGLHPHWQGRLYAMLGLLGLLLLAAIFAISFGSVEVPFFYHYIHYNFKNPLYTYQP
jgi:hypothetical protein